MNKLLFKRVSTWVIIFFLILIIISICIYISESKFELIIPIGKVYTPEVLFSTITSLIILGFTLYKWFRRGELINEYNEMNRMKSHLFNNLSCKDFKEIINLSYFEIYSKYEELEAKRTMQTLGDKIENLETPTR